MSLETIISKIKQKHKLIGNEIVLEEIWVRGRKVAYISITEDNLKTILNKYFKGELDLDRSGWRKYIEKWRKEGIIT